MWWAGVLLVVAGVATGLLVGLTMRRQRGEQSGPIVPEAAAETSSVPAGTSSLGPKTAPSDTAARTAAPADAAATQTDPDPAALATDLPPAPPAAGGDAAHGPAEPPPREQDGSPGFTPLPTRAPVDQPALARREFSDHELSTDMLDLLAELPGIVLVVDEEGRVVVASEAAIDLRLVRRGRIAFESVQECADLTLALGVPHIREVTLRRPPMRRLSVDLRVQGIPLPDEHVLLLLTDLTEEHRLAAVRRDFIANISHELKTPVGAMALLSEALAAARDDPDAVEHFAGRMQTEARRLTTLINDVIDLSRVQGDNPLAHAEIVSVDDLVGTAIDFVRGAAEIKGIDIVVGGEQGDKIFGDPGQLETALRNVLVNAVAYSEPGTKVAIAVRASTHLVEIDVKDQGMGIPEAELDRIFERFYRVDAARSRVTGGTGLGLSIVRNVCRNHGGDCLVWSVENEGSTFTLQLPRYVNHGGQTRDEEPQ